MSIKRDRANQILVVVWVLGLLQVGCQEPYSNDIAPHLSSSGVVVPRSVSISPLPSVLPSISPMTLVYANPPGRMRDYNYSEAKDFLTHYSIRYGSGRSGTWLASISRLGPSGNTFNVSILSHDPPTMNAYQINDLTLAHRLGIRVYDGITQEDLNQLDHSLYSDVLLAERTGTVIRINNIRNTSISRPVLSAIEQSEIDTLTVDLNAEIRNDLRTNAGIYGGTGRNTWWKHAGIELHGGTRHGVDEGNMLLEVFHAIRDRDRATFIQKAAKFVNLFDPRDPDPRRSTGQLNLSRNLYASRLVWLNELPFIYVTFHWKEPGHKAEIWHICNRCGQYYH